MILIDLPCEHCIHYKGKINSWNCGCDAFPDGFSRDFNIFKIDVRTLKECANGYKFEPKE